MFIGREKEVKILNDNYKSDESSFIAIYGRRRVGKTYLIRQTFGDKILFSHTGMYQGNTKEQLDIFASSLKESGLKDFDPPKNWIEAFDLLKDLVKKSSREKKVLFIDELSWMDTPKSDLIKGLENFYNGWASARNDVMLIICSSVTSWIMNKVTHSKGGLYNRLTTGINLLPFTLKECEEYCNDNHLALTRKQIIETYMVIGGIPYYWNLFKKGESVSQFIDKCFFGENPQLSNELEYIFNSLFRKPADYFSIIKALSGKQIGLTRKEIINETKIIDNGQFSGKLDDLINCGFIREYYGYNKKSREIMYQIIDPFTIFHFHFLTKKTYDSNFWENQINNPKINTWQGLAFERICLIHHNCIKKSLGISGVSTSIYPWKCSKDLDNGIYGSQIDMVIERKDDIINLIEIKYSSAKYVITKKYMDEIYKKKSDFVNKTHTRSAVHITFITLNGIEENSYSKEVQSFIDANDLFE